MIVKANSVAIAPFRRVLLLGALAALAYQALAADAVDTEHKPPQRLLNIKPQPIAADTSVKYDYDIVYVRAPRTTKSNDGKERPAQVWPEIGHPYNLQAVTDLMLLHPDGSEEVLVAGGKGAIADPYVSFDAQWVYYTYYHEASGDPYRLKSQGADIYKVNVKTRQTVRLTEQQWTPNTGVADWSADFRTPAKGKTALNYGVANMHPCPLPGGRVAFVSNRDGFKTPRGYPTQALQLFVMDDDGKNVEKIGHLNIACALHPVILKDGRIIFSSLESQGMHDTIIWGIWSIHPDGTNWGPIVSALFEGGASDGFHFQSQLSDGAIVVERYYNQNTLGFGTYYTLPPAPPEGVPGFGPAKMSLDPKMLVLREGRPTMEPMRFLPYGMKSLTRFTHGSDSAAPPSDAKDPKSPRVGKVQHPCGAPDNHLLTIWSPGATNNANGPVREPVHSGIYLIKSGKPIWEPGEMLLIKHDPNTNAQWPRPLVPYKRIYGVDEPARLTALRNDGKAAPSLPEGTPFGLVGTSSLYKRESFPDGVVPAGSVTATGDLLRAFVSEHGHWEAQGSDAGLYANSEIQAIRILAMESASLAVTGKFANHANERLRILGEFPVRKFIRDGQSWTQPTDPDGNPDTSFLAKIPANMAFTFQMIDKDGMNLTMAQTWHQVRPGEVRNNCGGCHAHSQQPTPFDKTAAAKADYAIWNLTEKTPLLTAKKLDESNKKWDSNDEVGVRFVQGVKNVEYWRDVRPILERSCVACHTQKAKEPAGELVLDADDQAIEGHFNSWSEASAQRKPPGTYFRLAMDNGMRNSSHHPPMFGKRPEASKNGMYWRFPLASRYVTKFQSRRSLLIWKIYGRRTDGLPESWLTDKAKADKLPKELLVDYNPAVMPPPEAVAGTYVGPDGQKIKVAPLSDEDRRTLVRWIDLGCPIDLDYDPAHPEKPGRGWMLDDQRPTLTLTYPQAGANQALTRLLVGMHDYGTGLDENSLEVVADFPVDDVPAGENLAKKFKALPDYRWELQLTRPIAQLPKGKLTVSVKDKQGNTSRIERTFSVGSAKP
jgi:Hydrazine synthase alpha subunit middle domain